MPPKTRKRHYHGEDEEEQARETRSKRAKAAPKPKAAPKKSSSSAEADASILHDTNAVDYFKAQKAGGKGIRKVLKDADNEMGKIKLPIADYERFHEQQPRAALSADLAHEWLWLTTTSTNILVFGVGDKSSLLDDFCKEYLEGEDALVLDGNPHPKQQPAEYATNTHTSWARNMLAVLNCIAESVLKRSPVSADTNPLAYARDLADRLDAHYGRTGANKVTAKAIAEGSTPVKPSERSAPLDALDRRARVHAMASAAPKYGGRYAHTQARLYLVVSEICGPAFAHMDAQSCLAVLAGCKSISMVASVDFLNVSFLWDAQAVSRFAWSYCHCSTYQHHLIPADHIFLANNDKQMRQAGLRGETSMQCIEQSMPQSHKDLLALFCRKSLDKRDLLDQKAMEEDLDKGNAKKGKGKKGKKAARSKEQECLEDPRCIEMNKALFAEAGALGLGYTKKQWTGQTFKNFKDQKLLEVVEAGGSNEGFIRLLLPDEFLRDMARRCK